MSVEIGIIFAFVAMLCWGFGDFLIQKSTRKFGNVETLFLISLFGAIVLLPFIYKDISAIFSTLPQLLLLTGASIVLLVAALLDFEALKRGKIAVVEPIYALEIPVAILLSFFIIQERLLFHQIALISLLVIGLILVATQSHHFSRKVWLEKGVVLVFLGTIFMGGANFLVGIGSRATDPLMINWFMSLFLTIVALGIMIKNKNISFIKDIKQNKKLLFNMCLLDNAAWVAFAFAMTLSPIAIAVALSESYIIIAVLLGMYVNKEFLKTHQKIGLGLAIISAIALAAITV